MCQLCEIQCSYCGEDCGGLCPDNETCPSCWTVDNYGEFDDEAYHDCRDTLCECPCHEEDDELSMFGFDSDDEEEDDDGRKGKVIAGVDNPVEKKVAKASQISFRFLDLPTELRDKIYKYTLKQTGSHRTTPFLKGRINTAILFTCRQINLEARHIPLLINQPSFANAFAAFRFVVSVVAPTQRQLVRSLHIEVQGMGELHTAPYQYFIAELEKMSLEHLSITLRGAISEDWLVNSDCLKKNLEKLKGLEKFDMIIGCGYISKKIKDSVVKGLRKAVVGRPPAAGKSKKEDGNTSTKATSKKASDGPSCVSATPFAANSMKPGKNVAQKRTVTPEDVEGLLQRYQLLADYAESIDGALSVKIRLQSALNAAEEGSKTEFDTIAKGIVATLEEQFAIIHERRNKVLEYSS